jgi:hypothetical protein
LQVFGVEPPIALYKAVSPFEDEPASHNTITEERIKTYLALSSSDLLSVYTRRSSTHSSLSSISIAVPSPDSIGHEVDESDGDPTPTVPLINSNGDLNPFAQDSYDRLDDGSTVTFRRRRLRAAKLTRFFGVAYNDLSIPTATATRTSEEVIPISSREVGVTIQERGRFWNRAEGGHRERAGAEGADMNDVIALLRQMPRA